MRHHLEYSFDRLRNARSEVRADNHELVLVVSVGAAIAVGDHLHRGIRAFTEPVRVSNPLRWKHPELLAHHGNRSALDFAS